MGNQRKKIILGKNPFFTRTALSNDTLKSLIKQYSSWVKSKVHENKDFYTKDMESFIQGVNALVDAARETYGYDLDVFKAADDYAEELIEFADEDPKKVNALLKKFKKNLRKQST